MDQKKTSPILADLQGIARAKKPIDPVLLIDLPHFTTIFPDPRIRALLVCLSGDDGIAYFERKQFRPGARLIARGQMDQMIYWVLEGHVHVVTAIKDKEKVIHESQRGECFGALGVLRGTARTADVVAGENGVTVLELDWSITERNQELGKQLYHLIALTLADNLDRSYLKQIKIIANSLKVLHEKTSYLIDKNRKLEKLLATHQIDFGAEDEGEHTQLLGQAIANIRESLVLLENQEEKRHLDSLGTD